ncbi:hypothetical protein [Companilactobacillus halodurans]|uniref:YfhO family protein n=1 Tax=Companilactobacillus halodurans TaxID=2584183 RepID=A0A5P0ZUK0_9LACO|nr:hypothetical protein [Companilactobacillus halodurans]MQS96691.1 hypothetical protein [Companilactobacillus halodurans]
MNLKNKSTWLTIIIALGFFAFLFGWTIWQFHFNYMVAAYDTIFHSQRIYEIRLAFQSHHLPSWVNFNTFFFTGQAINGMYPDFTLWPFVLLTNFLTPIHQIIAIRTLIALASFIVTFLSLNKRFNSHNAVMAAAIFALSGSVLKDLTGEMQSGTAIIMIFIFPIFFTFKEIIQSQQLDKKLIIKTALLMTIVVNSHLLSAITLGIVVGIFLIVNTVIKHNFKAWLNLLIEAILTIILSLPIIYRVMTISKTGLLSPFGKGNITSPTVLGLISNLAWDSKATISLTTAILLVVSLIGLRKNNWRNVLPWYLVELVLIVLSTDIFPWKLFNNVPIINNFQVANWRFGIFIGVIPIILILKTFKKSLASIILLIMVIISFPMATKTAIHNQHFMADDAVVVTNNTQKQIPQNNVVKLSSTGINSDKIMRSLLPDYSPNTTPLQQGTDGMFLDQSIIYLLSNHLGQIQNKELALYPTTSTDSVTWSGKNIPSGKISLPTYGYKSLDYQVTVNGKKVPYSLNQYSLITVKTKKMHHASFKINWLTPKIYYVLLAFSLLIFILLGISLFII